MILSSVVAAMTPTGGFVIAIVIGWVFNLWCGMRADGVTIINCSPFSWTKFRYALLELLMFLTIMEIISISGHSMGDGGEIVYACKTISYFVWYCYLKNGLRNLCKVYKDSKALWLIYLFVSIDLKRLTRIEDVQQAYEEHEKRQAEKS